MVKRRQAHRGAHRLQRHRVQRTMGPPRVGDRADDLVAVRLPPTHPARYERHSRDYLAFLGPRCSSPLLQTAPRTDHVGHGLGGRRAWLERGPDETPRTKHGAWRTPPQRPGVSSGHTTLLTTASGPQNRMDGSVSVCGWLPEAWSRRRHRWTASSLSPPRCCGRCGWCQRG